MSSTIKEWVLGCPGKDEQSMYVDKSLPHSHLPHTHSSPHIMLNFMPILILHHLIMAHIGSLDSLIQTRKKHILVMNLTVWGRNIIVVTDVIWIAI